MKLVTERPFANPEVAVRQLVQLTSGIEPVQDGRIPIEKINYPFLYMLKGSGIDFAAGIRCAVGLAGTARERYLHGAAINRR
ncbi:MULTISPECIES: hypothetical protein [unclassified Bradyrhizobium]|uniref:hypothetical protein n=1 Tax=unclassified Bradyrhizobium TaxID=2631580 RepID=UPI0033947C50